MKALGIYERANIIVMADHGANIGGDFNPAALFMLKQAGEAHAETQVSNAPVAQEDLWPTLASLMGLDWACPDGGRPVFDYREDEQRERITYHWIRSPDYPPTDRQYNALAAYRFTDHALRVNMAVEAPWAVYPVADSYY